MYFATQPYLCEIYKLCVVAHLYYFFNEGCFGLFIVLVGMQKEDNFINQYFVRFSFSVKYIADDNFRTNKEDANPPPPFGGGNANFYSSPPNTLYR